MYWRFPGDNILRYPTLIEETRWQWHALVDFLKVVAREFKLTPNLETLERWLRICSYSDHLDRLLDHHLTDVQYDNDAAHHAYVGLVQGVTPDAHYFPEWITQDLLVIAALFNSATVDTRVLKEATRLALIVGDCAGRKKRSRRIIDYTKSVIREGGAYGPLLAIWLTEQQPPRRRYRRFYTWTVLVTVTGCLLDHAKDLPKDYAEGRTAVRPTLRNRGVLAVCGVALGLVLYLRYPKVTWVANGWFDELLKVHSKSKLNH
jgi:hypothetical protein